MNLKFQGYLMSCYLYYERNAQVLSDCEFDAICFELWMRWDSFEHQHKYLVTRDDLQAGTGYAIKDYPLRVRSAAHSWYDSAPITETISYGSIKS